MRSLFHILLPVLLAALGVCGSGRAVHALAGASDDRPDAVIVTSI